MHNWCRNRTFHYAHRCHHSKQDLDHKAQTLSQNHYDTKNLQTCGDFNQYLSLVKERNAALRPTSERLHAHDEILHDMQPLTETLQPLLASSTIPLRCSFVLSCCSSGIAAACSNNPALRTYAKPRTLTALHQGCNIRGRVAVRRLPGLCSSVEGACSPVA